MKIIVLHGEDSLKSYDRLKKFIESANKRSWEVIYVDESALSFPETLSGTSLFEKERFYVLRDLKKLGKKELDWLSLNADSIKGNLVIYHDEVISQLILKALPKATKIEIFTLPKILWGFLEHLYPGNSRQTIREFHSIIETEPVEFVFSVIAKQFRDLYWAKTDSASMPFPPWRVSKLKVQASKFTEPSLIEFIELLSQIDVDAKTGKGDLVSSLDLLIVKKLK